MVRRASRSVLRADHAVGGDLRRRGARAQQASMTRHKPSHQVRMVAYLTVQSGLHPTTTTPAEQSQSFNGACRPRGLRRRDAVHHNPMRLRVQRRHRAVLRRAVPERREVPLDDSLLADRAPRTSRPSLTLTAGRVGLVTDTEADSHQRVSGIERQQPIPRRGDPGDGAQLPRAARPLRRSPAPDRLRRGAPAHRRHGPPSARPAPSGRPDRSSPSGPSGGPWSAG
jgi:hypothetical protein